MKIIILMVMLFSASAFSAKIVKVKGSKAYFSKSGLSVKKGQVLKVYADGYEVGRIKVLKTSGKMGVAKILEGAIGKGDTIKGGRKKGRKGKSSRSYEGVGRNTFYGGLSFVMPQTLTTDSQDLGTFGMHTGIALSFDYYLNKKMAIMADFTYSFSGSFSVDESVATNVEDFDSTFMSIHGDFAYFFGKMFYGKAGLGISRVNYSGTVANVALDETLTGWNWGIGGGAKYDFSKTIAFKFDISYRNATYTTIDGNEGSGATGDGQAQSHIDILILAGYKF